jgi:hypothetical protein
VNEEALAHLELLRQIKKHRNYPYFDVVVRLACSNDSESNTGGNVVTVMASDAGEVKGDDLD